jgi:uncharacterized C2H2 Zn-finger protein
MTDVSEYLVHLSAEQLIVCRMCKYALQPKGIDRHFKDHHCKVVRPSARAVLQEWADSKAPLDAKSVSQPTTIVTGYDCLTLIEGLQCSTCGTLGETLKSLNRQCNKNHGWVKSHGYYHLLRLR